MNWDTEVAHLISVITDLKNRNISFVSITEGMDTITASGELFFHILGALSQFERRLIQERVKAGLEAAKNRGIRGGRLRAISEEKMIAIKKALNDGMSKASICRTFEVKRSTIYWWNNSYKSIWNSKTNFRHLIIFVCLIAEVRK